jgi:hypothetical protein
MINNYLRQLYAYLGSTYCFLSGAFIIQDDNGILFELLKKTPKKKRKLLQSHTTYFQGNENPHPDLAFYETILNNKLFINCSCHDKEPDTRDIRSIKWYKFFDNDISFIYLKPESSPTITTRHAFNALNRYVIGNPNVSCRIPRREDCYKDKTGCMFIGDESNKNYNAILYKREGDTYYSQEAIQETYNRKGDEVFIPSIINTYIVNNIDYTSIFEYGVDKNDIILVNPINITGGKNRRYKHTSKRTRRRRRTRRRTRKNIKKSLRKKIKK